MEIDDKTTLIIIKDNLPPQVCFEKEGFTYCNWVTYIKNPDYAIISSSGKWLKFEITVAKDKNKSLTFKVKDSDNSSST